ncbi:unnamed protein product, partial [Mesorhabditis belari]|uniref:Uncharacterized protein n=1 Tax=Mesorhabditis belari TaxID=2138241 RepID=A0AAF3F266_9BILA
MVVQTRGQTAANLELDSSELENENELNQLPEDRMHAECYVWVETGAQPDFLFPWQSRECQVSRVHNREGVNWLFDKMAFLMCRYGHNKEPLPECISFSLYFIGQLLNLLLKQCWEAAKARCDQKKEKDSGCRFIITYDDYIHVMSTNLQQFLEELAFNGFQWTSLDTKFRPGCSLIRGQEVLEAETFWRFLGGPPMEKRVLKILDAFAHQKVMELTAMALMLRDYESEKGHPYGKKSCKSSHWTEDESWIEIRHYEHASRINKSGATCQVMDAIIEASKPPKTRKQRNKKAGFQRSATQKTKRSRVARI